MNKSTFKFYTYLLALLVVPFFLLSGCEHVNQPATTQPTPVLAKVALLANAASLAKVAPLDCSDTGLYQELMNPPTLAAKDLNINTQLSAKLTDKCVNGKIIALQSYLDTNAGIDKRAVGPSYILDVDAQLPHPKLAIEFSNKLGDSNKIYDCGHHGKDVSQCTNLHVHGLHVSPKGSLDPAQVQSDFVFLAISPATQTVKYDYEIPSSHPPGTHWLHAHLHGSTASQLKQGMAGAIILKGALDKTLAKDYGITGSKDKVMILQQLSTDANNTPLCGKASSGENITTSINGQCLPIITVMAGDINRWRFIDAGISESINIAVVQADGVKLNLHEFARDGITTNGTQVQKNILLQPGYRSDVLLQFPECKEQYPCELFLVDDVSKAANSLMGEAEPAKQIAKIIIQKNTLAAIKMPASDIFHNPYPFICDTTHVQGAAAKIKFFNDCSEKLAKEKVWFANVANESGGTNKTVNDGVYPNTLTKHLKLNGSNTWKLWVGEKQTSTASHPFHIHVNPFQLIDKNGFSYWKDTLLVSGTDNKSEKNALTVLSRYDDFDGEFVLHCHNLDHEDQGMMMNVTIDP